MSKKRGESQNTWIVLFTTCQIQKKNILQRKISTTGRTPDKTCSKVRPKVQRTDKYNQYFCKDTVKKQMNTRLDLFPAQIVKILF